LLPATTREQRPAINEKGTRSLRIVYTISSDLLGFDSIAKRLKN
jgi:hypothetical protein